MEPSTHLIGSRDEGGMRRCFGCDDLLDPKQREGSLMERGHHHVGECLQILNGRVRYLEAVIRRHIPRDHP